MYIPKHFQVVDQAKILSFIRHNGFGQLISVRGNDKNGENRPDSSLLPFLINDDCSLLTAHMARQNPQWRELEGKEVLVSFVGPHAYISPSWYHSPGVPTWNYQVVNIVGTFKSFTDSDKLAQTVGSLTDLYEAGFEQPWQADYSKSKLQAIVGVEIEVTELQAKFKLSQNRSKQDQTEVIAQLRRYGSDALATAMEKNGEDN